MAVREKNGFQLEEREGIIVSISSGVGGRKFSVGDAVVSNGRIFEPDGTRGIIIEIREPFANGRTDDVLGVRFGERKHDMKEKDLR